MLEIAPEGLLFDDKRYPALNRDKPFRLQDFQTAAKMLCVVSGIQSWLLHAFDRFNQVQATLFFHFPLSFSKRLFYLLKLKGSKPPGTTLMIPMKGNRKPGSICSLSSPPDRLQTLLQGEVLALSASLSSRSASFWCAQLSPRNKADKAPRSSETFVQKHNGCAYTSKNISVHLH